MRTDKRKVALIGTGMVGMTSTEKGQKARRWI